MPAQSSDVLFTMAGGLESTRQVKTASKEDSSLDVETVRWTVGESKKRQMFKFKPKCSTYSNVEASCSVCLPLTNCPPLQNYNNNE